MRILTTTENLNDEYFYCIYSYRNNKDSYVGNSCVSVYLLTTFEDFIKETSKSCPLKYGYIKLFGKNEDKHLNLFKNELFSSKEEIINIFLRFIENKENACLAYYFMIFEFKDNKEFALISKIYDLLLQNRKEEVLSMFFDKK